METTTDTDEEREPITKMVKLKSFILGLRNAFVSIEDTIWHYLIILDACYRSRAMPFFSSLFADFSYAQGLFTCVSIQ